MILFYQYFGGRDFCYGGDFGFRIMAFVKQVVRHGNCNFAKPMCFFIAIFSPLLLLIRVRLRRRVP